MVPFVDMDCLVVICGNYRELGRSQVKMALSPDYDRVLGSFCGPDGSCQLRAPSQLKKPFVGEGWQGGRSKGRDEENGPWGRVLWNLIT